MSRTRLPRAERELRPADLGFAEWSQNTTPAKRAKPSKPQAKPFTEPAPPGRGWARPYAGRAPLLPAVPVHRGSTGQVSGLYPYLYGQPLPPLGVYIGVDVLSGGTFSAHPVEWLKRGITTNPNLLITGNPGVGKSALLKVLMLRLMASGVRAFVLGDLKNEYSALARAVGVEPVELGPGIRNRINPLDAGPAGRNLPTDPTELRERLDDIHRRRLTLLASLLEVRLGRRLEPTEEVAVSLAIRHASGEHDGNSTLKDPTIPQVWTLLRDPTDDMAAELRFTNVEQLREAIRPAADALAIMVSGSLAGLFDGPTTVAPDFDAFLQTVDISRLDGRADETVSMTLACVSTWGQAAIDEPGGPLRLIVRDELWRPMRIPAMVRKLDSDLRLSRSQGTIQLLSTHRLSDFEAVGAADSEEVAIARGIVASCDIRVCLAQDTKPLKVIREEVGLTDTEAAQIAGFSALTKGRALWKVGRDHSHVVQTILSAAEEPLVDTDARMAIGQNNGVSK
ncbi:type VI secretion protein [Glycomyces sp. NPDC048151]|uniref:type VI secretion protein n=1 Tax=Glycomyces sp. NPDC048151 TaxID=3364002 RepID=UPI003717009B